MRKFRQGGRYQPGVKAPAGGDVSGAKFRLGESSGVKVPVGGKLWRESSGWGKALVEGDASDAKLRLGESPDWG
ncbi:MAG: hypothetical protein ACI4OV_00015 [Victivallaceae bacterium]